MIAFELSVPLYLSPEFELLAVCANPTSGEVAERKISRLLGAKIDWGQFFFLAEKNQVVPLVYRRLDAFSKQLPESVIRTLRCRYAAIASWNLLLAFELKAVLGLFTEHGIPAVPCKGPVLGLALYGDLSLRQADDLDIFIETHDLAQAIDLLQGRGYRLADPDGGIGTPDEAASVKDVVVENRTTGVRIELHWAICERSVHNGVRDFSPCCRECGDLEFLGSRVRVASPEDTLLMLSVHGMRHYWNRLKWILDIARLVEVYPELDWERAVRTADAFSCRRTFLLPHILIRDLLGVPVPAALARLTEQDASQAPLARRVAMDLAADADAPVWPQCRSSFKEFAELDFAQKMFRLRSKDSMRDRWKLFAMLIRDFARPDAEDLEARPFLSRIKFVFWIIQPVRVARGCGLKFFFRTSRQLLAALMR